MVSNKDNPASQGFEQRLDHQQIESLLNAFSGKLHLFDTIDSTSSWLMHHGDCGDICLSEQQTAGRGRHGNEWRSPDAGNIYLSLCWCFNGLPEQASLLGLASGLAVTDMLQQAGLMDHAIKWPNDIFWQGRKMGGILLETHNKTGRIVIGVGLNIAMSEKQVPYIDQPWVSLKQAISKFTLSRNQLVAMLINHLVNEMHNFTSLNLDDFFNRWRKRDYLFGKQLQIRQGNSGFLTGVGDGIDQLGRLKVRSENGIVDRYSSADISLSPAIVEHTVENNNNDV